MRVFRSWTRYLVDHKYYGIAALVESYVDFLLRFVWKRFNAVFYSSYNKFLAAIEGKIDISQNPEIVKYVATTGTEGRLRPSINVDITSVEPDENITPLFFNFFDLSATLEKAMYIDDAIVINSNYILIPQLSYVKVNMDCTAVFDSWYEKVDFEFSLLQAHKGINRLFTPYKMEVVVPLNGYLEQDLNLNQNTPINVTYLNRFAEKRRLNQVVFRMIYPTGREGFHITHFSNPKINLTSLNDSSEKYGGDRLPDFKTTFSVTVEDYVMSSYIVINTAQLDGIANLITDFTNVNPIFNNILRLLYTFFERLFAHLGIPFSINVFINLLNQLMNLYNLQTIEELLNHLSRVLFFGTLEDILVFLNFVRTILQNLYNIDVPIFILQQLFNDVIVELERIGGGNIPPLYFLVPNENISFFPVSGACHSMPSNTVRFIIYEVQNFIPENSELRIPPSVWRITPTTKFVTVTNAYTNYYLDFNTQEIVISGPLLKGFRFMIVVQI